jgi:hypothetical protein
MTMIQTRVTPGWSLPLMVTVVWQRGHWQARPLPLVERKRCAGAV